MATMNFTLVTPEKIEYQADIESLSVFTKSGQIMVLPDHENIMTVILPGELIVVRESVRIPFIVGQGVLEVAHNTLTLLVNTTETIDTLDLERSQEAIERAKEAMQEKAGVYDAEYARLEMLIERNLARVKIGNKWKKDI